MRDIPQLLNTKPYAARPPQQSQCATPFFSSTISGCFRDCNVNTPNFVSRELEASIWENSGWTQCTLQALFELDFVPALMLEISCESDDNRLDETVWSFGRSRCWEDFPAKLRLSGRRPANASKLWRESRENLKEKGSGQECKICYRCHIWQQRESFHNFEAEDSSFLFSNYIVFNFLPSNSKIG
jgi:hypothetical protein